VTSAGSIDALASLASRVQSEGVDPAAVRVALERAFERTKPESHVVRDFFVQRFLDAWDWIKRVLGLGHGVFGGALSWLVLALIVAALVALALRLFPYALRRETSAFGPQSASDMRAMRVADLRRRAREAEAAGDHAQALRFYFWALVVGLGQRGELEYRDAWTNRELLERGAPRPDVERVLRPLVPELDRKTFGRVPADADDVRRMAELCDNWLGAAA
jgi:hypothetical protein